jgi:hypothetical protein
LAERRPGAAGQLAGHQRWRLLCQVILLVFVSCRVYRQDPKPREQQGTSAEVPASVSGAAGAKSAGSRAEEPAVPSEALSLWVLNRPKADLVGRSAEAVDGSRAPEPGPGALPVVTVVLGLGPSHACAQPFAERALRYLEQGNDPLQSVSRLLDELRRWRWPRAKASLHAAVRSSNGAFGAIQSVAPNTLSSAMLIHAVSLHAVIDGENPRWARRATVPQTSGDTSAFTISCSAADGAELAGPVGVLLRTSSGLFLAAIADLEWPSDAGVISILTQYEMSLAAGPMGAVLVLSSCATLPSSVAAKQIYLTMKDPPRAALPTEVECQWGYAILGDAGAQVGGADPLAWASAVGGQVSSPQASPSGVPVETSDAGAASPATFITP